MGQINNGEIIFSDIGKIINDEWLKSFEIRNELHSDEYIIMPNHLHAIVLLNKTENKRLDGLDGSHGLHIETHGRASLKPTQQPTFIRKPKSISSFIAGFKPAINLKIDDFIDENDLDIPKYNRKNHFFQPNYLDHIIRNDAEYQRIKEYITNPLKWENDKPRFVNRKHF